MKLPKLIVLSSSLLSLIAAPLSFSAIDVLFIANNNSSAYETFVTNNFPGSSWTFAANGTGDNQVGGDLNAVRNFGTESQSSLSFMQNFDLVILGVQSNSGQFQDGQNGAVWASLNVPVLVHAAFIARNSDGRLGLFNGDGQQPAFLDTNVDSIRQSTSARADALFAGVGNESNLYNRDNIDAVLSSIGVGDGEIILSLNTADGHHGLVYWESGDVIGAGHTISADRAFFAQRFNHVDDFNADGKLVLANTIAYMTIPEPSTYAALFGFLGLGLVIIRRRLKK